MGFTVFRTVMTVLICLFLLFLFWVPSEYLVRVSDEAQALIEQANAALLRSDPRAAEQSCDALLLLYGNNEMRLERFLNHASIDAFGSALEVARAALTVNDTNAALEALAEAASELDRIRGIELFSPNSLF